MNGSLQGPCIRSCCWSPYEGICPKGYICNHHRSYRAGQDFNLLAASANAETLRAQQIPRGLQRNEREGNG